MKPELLQILEPAKCAVLVIDKQEAYLHPDQNLIKFLHTDTQTLQEILPQIDDFIVFARSKNVAIVWTQMIEDPGLSLPNIGMKMRLTDTPSIAKPNGPGFEIYGQATPESGDKVVVKNRFDAFIGTDLDEYLKSKNIESLVIVGAYASRCVLATAFVGNSLGYNIFVMKDLVGVPQKFMDELPVALGIADSILGFSLESQVLRKTWGSEENV